MRKIRAEEINMPMIMELDLRIFGTNSAVMELHVPLNAIDKFNMKYYLPLPPS